MLRVAVAILPELRQVLAEDPDQVRELLLEIHSEDLADILEQLEDAEAAILLERLPPSEAASIFERLEEDKQHAIVGALGTERAASLVSEMAADDRADLFDALPEEVGERLLSTLERVDPEAAAEVEELSRWPEETAGGLMTTDYVSVGPDVDVHGVIEEIRRKGEEAETVYYVYVVGDAGRLHGVVSLRDLLLAPSEARVREVMTSNVFAVSPETDQEEVARTMAKYDFNALPVVGPERRLLGVITVDDVMDVLTQEQSEDVQKLAAIAPLEDTYFQTGFWTFIRKRAVWLTVFFVGELFTGSVMRQFDHVLSAVWQLSYYVPLVVSTGGNSGSQSATLIIRGLAVGDLKLEDWFRILRREIGQGVVLGLLLAAVGAARVLLWGDSPRFAALIATSLVAIAVLGCVVGAMMPIALRRAGFDPATSSAPFIASFVDVVGIFLYLVLARWMLAEVIAGAARPVGAP